MFAKFPTADAITKAGWGFGAEVVRNSYSCVHQPSLLPIMNTRGFRTMRVMACIAIKLASLKNKSWKQELAFLKYSTPVSTASEV